MPTGSRNTYSGSPIVIGTREDSPDREKTDEMDDSDWRRKVRDDWRRRKGAAPTKRHIEESQLQLYVLDISTRRDLLFVQVATKTGRPGGRKNDHCFSRSCFGGIRVSGQH